MVEFAIAIATSSTAEDQASSIWVPWVHLPFGSIFYLSFLTWGHLVSQPEEEGAAISTKWVEREQQELHIN